ncbi:porin family protein [Aurantibacter sp.]|uniref:porin family protein n=1 Tax=Aurantibacter sp. TaxID=2807103 RepID=UPI0035C8153C
MKKSLLIIALLFGVSITFAQDNVYGVRAGFNVTNLDFRPDLPPSGVENAHRNGFAIGFLAEYGISEKFSIAPEIQFSAEGAKDKEFRLDYLQMPILLNYKITRKIALGVGPQFSLKAHDYEDGFKNVVYSGIAGLTYMITDEIFVDARFSYGLTDVFDDSVGLEAINKNLQFGFGIKL